jgi:hypothetical protein
MAHILKTASYVVREQVLSGEAWCGREIAHEWFFVSPDHASKARDGGIRCCKKCWKAAVRAGVLTSGAE